jgi:hypothetical protein
MLKGSWIDKKNDVDMIDANDINKIAHSIIDIENNLETYDKDIMALLGSDEP